MRRMKSIKRSYFWLKALIIIAIIAVAYLLITQQYLTLIELIICVVAGIISYRVIVHKLEHSSKKQAYAEQDDEQPVKTKQDKRQVDTEIDIREISTNDLIQELSRRGEIR